MNISKHENRLPDLLDEERIKKGVQALVTEKKAEAERLEQLRLEREAQAKAAREENEHQARLATEAEAARQAELVATQAEAKRKEDELLAQKPLIQEKAPRKRTRPKPQPKNASPRQLTDAVLLDTIKGHTGWVHSVAFSPNGKLLASGSSVVGSGKCQ